MIWGTLVNDLKNRKIESQLDANLLFTGMYFGEDKTRQDKTRQDKRQDTTIT
jgi:hypothetical protein